MLWGGLFLWLGEFDQPYDAIYHSAVNFSSLGYGDIVMTRERRLLGPLEAVNGVLRDRLWHASACWMELPWRVAHRWRDNCLELLVVCLRLPARPVIVTH